MELSQDLSPLVQAFPHLPLLVFSQSQTPLACGRFARVGQTSGTIVCIYQELLSQAPMPRLSEDFALYPTG